MRKRLGSAELIRSWPEGVVRAVLAVDKQWGMAPSRMTKPHGASEVPVPIFSSALPRWHVGIFAPHNGVFWVLISL